MSAARIAVVDIGTNTTRLLVAEVESGRVTRELHRQGRVTRLGAGVDGTGRLDPEALAREHAVLSDYGGQIERHRVDRAVAIMTSAVRDAADGGQFAEEVEQRHGLEPHVLSGEEEAELTYLGATDEVPEDSRERILVIDIGGGSTELVLGRGRSSKVHVSTQAGVVRQGDRHLHEDPPTPEELHAVADDVRQVISSALPAEARTGVERAIAVAGTPTSLAAIAMELDPYDRARIQGYRLSGQVRDEVGTRLFEMPIEERRRVRGLHPDRALVIVPGIVILTVVMELFGLAEVEVSEHDILRGAAVRFG